MKIVICASMLFSKKMIDIGGKLVKMGHEVILPKHVEKYAKSDVSDINSKESIKEKTEEDLIKSYYEKIKKADAVLIVNIDKKGIKNYIGGNSFLELGFGYVLKKKIYLLNPIPNVSYKDEIVAMKPIVLNGDLNKIR